MSLATLGKAASFLWTKAKPALGLLWKADQASGLLQTAGAFSEADETDGWFKKSIKAAGRGLGYVGDKISDVIRPVSDTILKRPLQLLGKIGPIKTIGQKVYEYTPGWLKKGVNWVGSLVAGDTIWDSVRQGVGLLKSEDAEIKEEEDRIAAENAKLQEEQNQREQQIFEKMKARVAKHDENQKMINEQNILRQHIHNVTKKEKIKSDKDYVTYTPEHFM